MSSQTIYGQKWLSATVVRPGKILCMFFASLHKPIIVFFRRFWINIRQLKFLESTQKWHSETHCTMHHIIQTQLHSWVDMYNVYRIKLELSHINCYIYGSCNILCVFVFYLFSSSIFHWLKIAFCMCSFYNLFIKYISSNYKEILLIM